MPPQLCDLRHIVAWRPLIALLAISGEIQQGTTKNRTLSIHPISEKLDAKTNKSKWRAHWTENNLWF